MMTLTKEEKEYLRGLKKYPDSDNIRFKEIIKQHLINNRLIIYALNNKELMESDAPFDEYLDDNIKPYYLIKPTQVQPKNYICYEVWSETTDRYNEKKKTCRIVFTILCEQKDIKDKTTGLARHDLLAHLIIDEFNWTNYFGFQIHLESDEPSVVDTNFACRTLVFKGDMLNNIVKTKNRASKMVTSEVHK